MVGLPSLSPNKVNMPYAKLMQIFIYVRFTILFIVYTAWRRETIEYIVTCSQDERYYNTCLYRTNWMYCTDTVDDYLHSHAFYAPRVI